MLAEEVRIKESPWQNSTVPDLDKPGIEGFGLNLMEYISDMEEHPPARVTFTV
jgi:hypothetical protein